MYRLQHRLESLRERTEGFNEKRANMPFFLLLVTPATTSSMEAMFTQSGKMPVVVGVAIIIAIGLSMWWIRTIRQLQTLERETPKTDENTTS